MKIFLIVFLAFVSGLACSMGGKSARLTADVDKSQLHWNNCTKEMKPRNAPADWDHRGKLCLTKCHLELEKNGTCKKGEYDYESKDHKEEHDFFNGMVMVPRGRVF